MTRSSIPAFSANPDFDYEIRTVLGAAYAGAADVGEVLAAVHGIGRTDHHGWYAAWNALGDRLAGEADTAAAAGHDVSAASAYLRASHYYAVAVNAASALDAGDELPAVFRRHRAAWDRFVDTTAHRVERVGIPYEDTTLPGYLFSPADGDGPHPLLVVVNGSDGSLSSLWGSCVSGALRRGYAALVFDGPGQQSMLFERATTFRPDWEAVLTPVYDFVAARADVDTARIALYGISQGGFWTPRALAVEHRYAAAVLDPGVVDVSSSWTDHFPKSLRAEFERGEFEKFDKSMAFGMRFSPGGTKTWAFRARPYGTGGEDADGRGGYAGTLRAVRQYTLDDEAAARITTPLLLTDPEGGQFWPGQSARLATLAPAVSTVVPFTAAEGAGLHCEPLARALVEQRMFDWLDERLSPAAGS